MTAPSFALYDQRGCKIADIEGTEVRPGAWAPTLPFPLQAGESVLGSAPGYRTVRLPDEWAGGGVAWVPSLGPQMPAVTTDYKGDDSQ